MASTAMRLTERLVNPEAMNIFPSFKRRRDAPTRFPSDVVGLDTRRSSGWTRLGRAFLQGVADVVVTVANVPRR